MKRTIHVLFVCLWLFWPVQPGTAKVALPALVSDGMVLQRDREIPLWGSADPGEAIEIRFLGETRSVTADAEGNWSVKLSPAGAGGPYTLQVNDVEIKNILVGDVWLCSGQSNMELPVSRVMEMFREEVETYSNPMIRHLKVPLSYDFHGPRQEIAPAEWKELTPGNALAFSAVAYFFARELHEATGIPIGLINASVGGSPAEAWISEEGLKPFPAYLNERDIWRDDQLVEGVRQLDRARRDSWNQILYQQDKGLNEGEKWFSRKRDDSQWETVDLFDTTWGSDGVNPVNGVHWLRKAVTIPSHLAGNPALLRLGCIVDADSVFVNGTFVGTTAYQYPPRNYPIPAGLLEEGENNITARLISYSGYPGFVKEKPYEIRFDTEKISLEGAWKYKQGTRMPALPGETFFQYKPTGLYNAMIAPLLPVNFKGVLWYQGESNTGRHNEYRGLMEALIGDWRARWEEPALPFLIAQLSNFMQDPPYPSESHWAELRNAQRELVNSTPHTGLAVTIDIGEWNDIHPLNKKEAGRRLSLQARRIAYKDNEVIADGPIFRSMHAEGSRLILSFEERSNDLLPVQELKGFAIAGADGKFEWAQAAVKGNQVEVWSKTIAEPTRVRYAWRNNPEEANLKNRRGLPASPFEAGLTGNEQPRQQ